MEPAIQRANELNIALDVNTFSISNRQLFQAIAEDVDLETITNHELMEIFFIVRDRMINLNWKELVTYSIAHLPFGLNQTHQAWEGNYPCKGCPDAMLEDNRCYHDMECKAMQIYDARF